MPVDFTADETAALIDLLVGIIERHPFPQSMHVQRLRGILEKIRPRPELPSDEDERLFDDVTGENGFDDLIKL